MTSTENIPKIEKFKRSNIGLKKQEETEQNENIQKNIKQNNIQIKKAYQFIYYNLHINNKNRVKNKF